ncbi:hypothetical protein E2320_001859 [Naja naja]|nr:hypothetical protein E2320_001859 [Naja naja]
MGAIILISVRKSKGLTCSNPKGISDFTSTNTKKIQFEMRERKRGGGKEREMKGVKQSLTFEYLEKASCPEMTFPELESHTANSDHWLLVAKLKLKLCIVKKVIISPKFSVNIISSMYVIEVKNRTESLNLEDKDPNEQWSKIQGNIMEIVGKSMSKIKENKQEIKIREKEYMGELQSILTYHHDNNDDSPINKEPNILKEKVEWAIEKLLNWTAPGIN